MKNIVLIFLMIFISLDLQASFIASNNSKINPDLPTHVLVAGVPDKLEELFLYSLITRAKIYQEISPKEQIIIIGRSDDRGIIEDAGFKIIDKKMGLLKSTYIEEAISKVKGISSFDIYAHSNPMSGVTLDTNSWVYPLLNEKDHLWETLSTKLNANSFVFIHGCNAGIKFAPNIATKLNVAVFAALTSTDFQNIYDDAFWSFDYDAGKNQISKKNLLNYSSPKPCGMYCKRMKPDNASYKGHWGDWNEGGYPSYKLFCGSNQNSRCESGAIEGIITFPGLQKYSEAKSSLENFKKQLIDFMCPFISDSDNQKVCARNLENSLTDKELKSYSPFKGKTLDCDMIKCKAHFKCSGFNAAFNPDSCELVNDSEKASTAFTSEYAFLLKAWKNNQK